MPIKFARSASIPTHWKTFGGRQSPLSTTPHRAITPGNALLNYLYHTAASELTIAITIAGLDPSFAIFHEDRENRASLVYHAIEPIRPYVDAWLVHWLKTAVFSKRDFYEMPDGSIRLTRPLTSWLAATRPLWRNPSELVAQWLATCLSSAQSTIKIPTVAIPALSSTGLIPKTCAECGRALSGQTRYCSTVLSVLQRLYLR